jgi:L-lactate dehydrogenase (cytochrome)
LSWDDIAWVRQNAPNVPILIKGVQCPEDVALAKHYGADGVILSNHGGRQLDGASPPIATLIRTRQSNPELFKDGEKFEVYIDGGFRRGTE